jgi:signal transduction histidine kinase
MTQLLDDILTINRAETGKLEVNPTRLDLAKFCGNLVEEMRSCAGERYTISFASAGPCYNALVDENYSARFSPICSTMRLSIRLKEARSILP